MFYYISIAELIQIILSIIGISAATITSLIVYGLSKKISFAEKFSRREKIQKTAEQLMRKIKNGDSGEVELINIKKYSKHSPQDLKKDRKNHARLKTILRDYGYDGVEFLHKETRAYLLSDNIFSFKRPLHKHDPILLEVTGIVSYEQIEAVDINGDDTSYNVPYRPLFYVCFFSNFFTLRKTPFKKFRYFRIDDHIRKEVYLKK